MGKRKYPDWYYEPTSPSPTYPGLPKELRNLIYLLRNNGWNTTASSSEYKGVIVIQPYGEQFGWWQEEGGPIAHLRNFLWKHGYKHFEIKYTQFSWHGKLVDDVLVLKLLGLGWFERWPRGIKRRNRMSQPTPLTGIFIGLGKKEVKAAKDHLDSSMMFERCAWFLHYKESECRESFTLARVNHTWTIRPFCALCKKLTDFMKEPTP